MVLNEFLAEGNPDHPQRAVIVGGYDPIPGQLDPGALALARDGWDVALITYPKEVFTDGDPEELLRLQLAVTEYTRRHLGGSCVKLVSGASLGGGIAANTTRHPDLAGVNYIAGAGGIGFGQMVKFHPLFRPLNKIFKEKGYSPEEIISIWEPIDMSSERPPYLGDLAVMTVSRFDPVVPAAIASRQLDKHWRPANPQLQVITNNVIRHPGGRWLHSAAIDSYVDSLPSTARRIIQNHGH